MKMNGHEPTTVESWVNKCAARIVEQSGMKTQAAVETAMMLLEEGCWTVEDDPVEAADAEMDEETE